jgi:uncharacterized protein YacL (UPF0231 family)
VDWLKSEIEKDKLQLEAEKQKMIDSIKELKKEEIVKPKEKLTLWKRIKKVMVG